ncbi:hypothetical protein Pla123a_33280 [Posidoniimonas polymericola]|uniref:Uncharacterized protein n=1 Tax=Posidoniimonas polymericola TaxID=2528002 RepID=A0A5C5YHT1_9BACT|nr:hypothetical protein [Posidoniimonas polymericola]TWT74505.1 hypothetical protein Pla123a_33280 [Posidoniimonas polymericola]
MNTLKRLFGRSLAELDQLLRGAATRPALLNSDKLGVSARGLAVVSVLLAMFYGACMGSYSLLKEVPPDLHDPYGPYLQVLASTIKTPALFLLTLLITLPSLYVFNALVGSRLTLIGMTRLLVAALAVNIAVLASLGTIVVFFSLTTGSYAFIRLLNVAVFTVAGVLGLMFLLQTLHRLIRASEERELSEMLAAKRAADRADDGADGDAETAKLAAAESILYETDTPPDAAVDESRLEEQIASALDMPSGQVLGRHTRLVFRCWIVLFSLVGAQMGWVLRPFIGSPDLPFTFFRERQSNFFAAVLHSLIELLSGGA